MGTPTHQKAERPVLRQSHRNVGRLTVGRLKNGNCLSEFDSLPTASDVRQNRITWVRPHPLRRSARIVDLCRLTAFLLTILVVAMNVIPNQVFAQSQVEAKRREIDLSPLEKRVMFDASVPISDVAHALSDLSASPENTEQLAFPTAEGFGAHAQGGRGGDVYHVTNLNDSGEGSLRYGVEKMTGPRTIVFDLGGTIELKSRLTINSPFLTIAGQTAPGDGITVANHRVIIRDTNDIIVRYIRFRAGDLDIANSTVATHDALSVHKCKNVIIDHVSASWGADETFDTSHSENVTLQWSIVSEAIRSDDHSHVWHRDYHLGSLIVGSEITMHHNLYAHHDFRMPALTEGVLADVTNNVFYDWSSSTPSFAGNSTSQANQVNFDNNAYVSGPSIKEGRNGRILFWANDESQIYAAGNIVDPFPNQRLAFEEADFNLAGDHNKAVYVDERFDFPKVETDDARDAYLRVLSDAGASLQRDDVDERIVDDVREKAGGLIDSQSEVGGFPILASGETLLDTDQDGMPDAWENQYDHLNAANPEDRNGDFDGDGYTNLEEYLNALVSTREAKVNSSSTVTVGEVFRWQPPATGNGAETVRYEIDWNGDGRADQVVTAPGNIVLEHTFHTSGVFNIGLSVTSAGNANSFAHEVTVQPETAPTTPVAPQTSHEIEFQADEGVTSLYFDEVSSMWAFEIDWNGDDRVDQTVRATGGLVAQHVYGVPGTYRIHVRAINQEDETEIYEFSSLVTIPPAG